MPVASVLSLLLLAAIWGSSFMFMRATAEGFGPVFLIAIRVGVAGLCLSGVFLAAKRWQVFKAHWKTLAWIGALNSALPFILLTYALLSLNAGFVSVINATVPLFTAGIAYLWLGTKLDRWQFVGLGVCVLGSLILVWDKLSLDGSNWLAILASFMAMLSYAIAINGTKKYLSEVDSMTATAGSLWFAGLFAGIASLFFLPDFSQVTTLEWGYALTLAVVCTAFAYVIFFKLIQDIGSTAASSVTFLVPIFAFAWAYFVLGEVVTWRMLVATVVIIFGSTLVLKLLRPASLWRL